MAVTDEQNATGEAPVTWPPGWYDVPDRVDTRGYWDGKHWTGEFAPKELSKPPTQSAGAWPPGWYDTPDRVNTRGYWDGTRWTGDFAPKETPRPLSSFRTGMVIALIGFGALAVGSVGPWATALVVSVSGTHGDGKITLGAAAIGAVLVLPRRGVVLALLAALAGLGVSIYDLVHVSQQISNAPTLEGTQIAQVGWGLYVATAGGALATLGALIQLRGDSTSGSQ